MNKKLIIKLNDFGGLQTSPENVKLNKIQSSISPLNFIKLLNVAENKVNPRNAKNNRITKDIQETLEFNPQLLLFKSKGLLLATQSCKILERSRVELSFENAEFEGIMDGGHNTLAIASFLIDKLYENVVIKSWEDCKKFWNENYDEILDQFKLHQESLCFSIPIEIIFPNSDEGAIDEYYEYLSEICSARNNNVQLGEASKGNHKGYYDSLKDILEPKGFKVIWKAGSSGNIKAEDVISLATIPLIFLKNNSLLPKDIKSLNKISVYSQKSKCVDFFNSLMAHQEITYEEKGRYILNDDYIESALSLTEDILRFFDKMYIAFPDLYNKTSPGRFRGIKAVNNDIEGKVPFHTTDSKASCQYPFGFFIPLVAGLTELMRVDEESNKVDWIINPNELDLADLDLTQYVNIIKLANFDPQKIGKGEVFYNDAETVFKKIALEVA
jgi:hypothetical protein